MTLARTFKACLLACVLTAVMALPATAAAAPEPAPDAARYPTRAAPALRDGQHDFDFEFGAWKAHITRRLHPLTGSTTWVEYEGTSVVHKLWDGRANQGELEVSGPNGRIEGMSLRLYDPQTRQWSVRWANSADGELTPPLIGGFTDAGHGEFYNQDTLNGRSILARFIFSDFTATTFKIEQAFSDDGGKTWEVNWIARFTKA